MLADRSFSLEAPPHSKTRDLPTTSTPHTMKLCTHCGVETPGRRFCTKCGTAFELVPTAFTIPSNQLIKPPPMLPAMTRSRSMGSEPSFLLTSTDKWSPFSVAYLRADATNNQLLSQRSKSARNVRDADAAVGDAKRVHFSEQPQYARPLEDSVDSGTGSRLSLFKGRYTDHPSCDLCFVEFDVTRHRRQWCVSPYLTRSITPGPADTRSCLMANA